MSASRFFVTVLLVVAATFGAIAGGAVIYGRERLWADLFGPPDMGPYNFDLPTRTGKPNDALACPADSCEGARPERRTPYLAAAGEAVYRSIRARVAALPGTEFVYESQQRLAFRAVVRTPTLRLGDTISVQVREDMPGISSFAIYSRSQVGHTDLGTNDARVRRLVRDIAREFPRADADAAGPLAPPRAPPSG